MRVSKKILFGCTIILGSCSSSVYQVVSESSYSYESQKVAPKKMILLNDELISGGKSHYLANLLNEKDWNSLDLSLQNMTSKEDVLFINGLKSMISKNYEEAYANFRTLNDEDYHCQVYILKTDCLLELKADSVNYKERYQFAHDCTKDEKVKEITKNRYRYVIYEK